LRDCLIHDASDVASLARRAVLVSAQDGDKKRQLPGSGSTGSPAKLARLHLGDIVEGQVVTEVLLTSLKCSVPAKLSIRMQHRVYVINDSGSDIAFESGCLIAAWGRGKFKAKAVEDIDVEKEIPFEVTTGEALVLVNNELTTFAAALQAKRPADPDAGVLYHSYQELPSGGLSFRRNHVVAFVPEGKIALDDAALQASAACLVPVPTWRGPWASVIWSCSWRPRGLIPIRRQVCFLKGGVLPNGRALGIA
jgi:hypothetical protein